MIRGGANPVVSLNVEPSTQRQTRTRSSARGEMDVADLYRRYGDMVLGRCRSLLGNEADAQETTQEIFLKLYRYRSGFRGEASPTTYLFKVTTTTCLNQIRTRKRRREELVETLPPRFEPDTMLDRVEIRQLVEDLLSDEPEATQAAVIFHFVDGLTHAETGALLGVSGAAIRKRIATFRKRIAANPPVWMDDE